MSGRSLPEALLMMIPEAWQQHRDMSDAKRAFYEYPLVLDRAMGRARIYRIQRRHLYWRCPRPQWSAAIALLHHRR